MVAEIRRYGSEDLRHNDRLHLPNALVTPLVCASEAPIRRSAPDALAGEAYDRLRQDELSRGAQSRPNRDADLE